MTTPPFPPSAPAPGADGCPRCHRPIPPGAAHGLCPACLLGAGFFTQPADAAAPGSDAPPPRPEDLAPEFPQLEIIELLGRGGMGAVYKARQRHLDRLVALKLLRPGLDADPSFAERFTREARALAQLNHPGIVILHEFGRSPGGLYFIVMEFVDGVNLRQLLAAGRLAPREALAIIPPLCDALQYAHDHGIVHRDIKPENILTDRLGRVKIADFGLAKLVADDRAPGAPASDSSSGAGQAASAGFELTEAGKVMGTPRYMAPEQREHPTAVDHRADIYALGVVLYQMLTGELPDEKQLQPPSQRVRLDVRLDEIVLRALEKNPALRYAAASELKTRIETLGPPPPALAPESRPLPLFAGCAAFTYALATAFGLGCLIFLDHVLGRWLMTAFLLSGVLVTVLSATLLPRVSPARRSLWARCAAWSGLLAWFPILGFAIFFAIALVRESDGPGLASAEAAVVLLVFLGAVLLPSLTWKLWWADRPATPPPPPVPPPASSPSEPAPGTPPRSSPGRSLIAFLWQLVPLAAVWLAFFNQWGVRGWYCFAAGCALLALLPGRELDAFFRVILAPRWRRRLFLALAIVAGIGATAYLVRHSSHPTPPSAWNLDVVVTDQSAWPPKILPADRTLPVAAAALALLGSCGERQPGTVEDWQAAVAGPHLRLDYPQAARGRMPETIVIPLPLRAGPVWTRRAGTVTGHTGFAHANAAALAALLPAAQAAADEVRFGETHEIILPRWGRPGGYSFENHAFMDYLPSPDSPHGVAASVSWRKVNAVDIFADQDAPLPSAALDGARAYEPFDQLWDAPAQETADFMRQRERDTPRSGLYASVAAPARNAAPATRVYRTQRGQVVLLQILGANEAGDVRIRYKLVLTAPEQAPRLRALDWLDHVEGCVGTAWLPDGKDAPEAEWRPPASPLASALPAFDADTPRYLCLWFSHPSFDRLSVSEVRLVDPSTGKVVGDPRHEASVSVSESSADHSPDHWLAATLSPGPYGRLPARVEVRLRFSAGDWSFVNELPLPWRDRRTLADGVSLGVPGQDVDGQAVVELTRDPALDTDTDQFDVIAIARDGRRLECSRHGISAGSTVLERFGFDTPLANLRSLEIRKRPVRTQAWTVPLRRERVPSDERSLRLDRVGGTMRDIVQRLRRDCGLRLAFEDLDETPSPASPRLTDVVEGDTVAEFFDHLTASTPYTAQKVGSTWVIQPRAGSILDFPVTLKTAGLSLDQAARALLAQAPALKRPIGTTAVVSAPVAPGVDPCPWLSVQAPALDFDHRPAAEALCQLTEAASPASVWELGSYETTRSFVLSPAPADAVLPVVNLAQAWLRTVDGGDYARARREGSGSLQSAAAEADWIAALNLTRAPLGDVTTRRLRSASPVRPAPKDSGNPRVALEFSTTFTPGRNAIEALTMEQAPDGGWHASAYAIQPPAPEDTLPEAPAPVTAPRQRAGARTRPPDLRPLSSPLITINVLGKVAHPGAYTIRSDATLLDALAAAGGWTARARLDKVSVLPLPAAAAQALPATHSVSAILSGQAINPSIPDRATISVPEAAY